MGFFARLFGTDPESRLAKARKFLEAGAWNDARMEVEGLDGFEAEGIRQRALRGLVELNLEEARLCLIAGDFERSKEHMDLAQQFGATADELREVRRLAREEAATRKAQAEKEAAERMNREVESEGNDPLWSLPPGDPRLRYAMMLEGWPEGLRARLVALGPEFASAVLSLEEGDPKAAYEALGAFVDREPAAHYERARAAEVGGAPSLAAESLAAFGDKVGHQRIGTMHSAIFHAQVLSRLGRPAEAQLVIEQALKKDPDLSLQAVRAQLLLANNQPAAAEKSAEQLISVASKDMGLYKLLAMARLAQNKRPGARAALEGGLGSCCSNPGKCGSQPYDVEVGRMLARLYLEDREDPARSEALLGDLAKHVQEPEWEDRYLLALRERNRGGADARSLGEKLARELPPRDPRRGWVSTHFQA